MGKTEDTVNLIENQQKHPHVHGEDKEGQGD